MQQYEISGTPKTDLILCKSCKGGKIFENKIYLKTDVAESEFEEPICGVCNTKYKIKRQEIDLHIPEDYKPSNKEFLSRTDVVFLMEDVMEKLEGENMTYAEDLVKFQETGLCEHPKIVSSNVVKTAEGEFVFNTCVVCKESTVDYKGKTYKGKIHELVNWIAQKGIEADKLLSKVPDSIDDLGLKQVAQIDTDSMFDEVKDEVSFF